MMQDTSLERREGGAWGGEGEGSDGSEEGRTLRQRARKCFTGVCEAGQACAAM